MTRREFDLEETKLQARLQPGEGALKGRRKNEKWAKGHGLNAWFSSRISSSEEWKSWDPPTGNICRLRTKMFT